MDSRRVTSQELDLSWKQPHWTSLLRPFLTMYLSGEDSVKGWLMVQSP